MACFEPGVDVWSRRTHRWADPEGGPEQSGGRRSSSDALPRVPVGFARAAPRCRYLSAPHRESKSLTRTGLDPGGRTSCSSSLTIPTTSRRACSPIWAARGSCWLSRRRGELLRPKARDTNVLTGEQRSQPQTGGRHRPAASRLRQIPASRSIRAPAHRSSRAVAGR